MFKTYSKTEPIHSVIIWTSFGTTVLLHMFPVQLPIWNPIPISHKNWEQTSQNWLRNSIRSESINCFTSYISKCDNINWFSLEKDKKNLKNSQVFTNIFIVFIWIKNNSKWSYFETISLEKTFGVFKAWVLYNFSIKFCFVLFCEIYKKWKIF
jgi:hypothetical protein